MASILTACKPREDIIEGSFNPEIFTASISQVASAYSGEGSAIDSIYTDAEAFFRDATFPTEGLCRVVRDVMGRLSGDNSKPAIHRLETAFGGGKTHTLIALTHLGYKGEEVATAAADVVDTDVLLPAGSVNVVAIACDEMPVIAPSGDKILAYTLWGEIALRLGGESFYQKYLDEVTSNAFPGHYFLERMFEGRKVLIMLDELAQYATRYEAAHIGGGEQISAFLMALLGYARTHDGVSVVMTLASQSDAFQGQTGMLQGVLSSTLGREVDQDEAEALAQRASQSIMSVVRRDATTTVPVYPNEISRVLARRLFTLIGESDATETAAEYIEMYQRSGAQLPDAATRDDYSKSIAANYPFHPSFIAYLTNKLASAESFQGTRGVLRVLAMAIRTIWQKNLNIPLIHTCHLNMANPDLADELIGRTGASDLLTVLNADVGGADSESLKLGSSVAQNLDRGNPHPKRLPLYEWTWKTVFLHSLVGRGEGFSSNIFGINFTDALLEVASPDIPPSQVETALKAIVNEAYYLRNRAGRYYADTDPTEAHVVSTIKQSLRTDEVNEQLSIVARKVFATDTQTFKAIQDVSDAEHIPDRTGKPVLAVIRLDAGNIDPTDLVTTTGDGQPRLEQNNVFVLVPETVQVAGDAWSENRVRKSLYRQDRLNDLARHVIAMRRLKNKPEEYGMSGSKLEESGFTGKFNERENALQTVVAQSYDSILYSGSSGQVAQKNINQSGGEGGVSIAEEIARVLIDEGELITVDKAATTSTLMQIGQLFFTNIGETPSIEQITTQFNQNRRWPILETDQVLKQIVTGGVEKGQWCLYRMDSAESTKPEHFHSRETGGVPVDLKLSEKGWKLVSEQGAAQRGWNPGAEPEVEQVKEWVEAAMKDESCTRVKDVIEKVREQHGSVKNATVLEAIDSAAQAGKVYTFVSTEADPATVRQAPDLVYGANAMFHSTQEDDALVTPATAAERGWIKPEDTRYTRYGHGLAVMLHDKLGKISSLYSRGASTHTDLLRLQMLDLPGGGKLSLDLVDVSPNDMKTLSELFDVLADLTTIGDSSVAQINVKQAPDDCAFLNLVKQADD
ncbi:ATP-binding protein [Candidatus Sororendozoicomonas aggregata]|uniref:ATP-binding protein n=1 Tax=Candidatus Sororendozoicomonas aggregata TaxID=3073239 RepID=UPI002ED5753C